MKSNPSLSSVCSRQSGCENPEKIRSKFFSKNRNIINKAAPKEDRGSSIVETSFDGVLYLLYAFSVVIYIVEFIVISKTSKGNSFWMYFNRPAEVFWTMLGISVAVGMIDFFTLLISWYKVVFRFSLHLCCFYPFYFLFLTKHGKEAYVPYFLTIFGIVMFYINKSSAETKNPKSGHFKILLWTFLSVVFSTLCLFQAFEFYYGEEIKYTVLEALYFVIVTVSTVGYGDISPKSIPGRLLVIAFILFTVFLIPTMISLLMEARKSMGKETVKFTKNGNNSLGVLGYLRSTEDLSRIVTGFTSTGMNIRQVHVFSVDPDGTGGLKSLSKASTSIRTYFSTLSKVDTKTLREISKIGLPNIVLVSDTNMDPDSDNQVEYWGCCLKSLSFRSMIYASVRSPNVACRLKNYLDGVISQESVMHALLASSLINWGFHKLFSFVFSQPASIQRKPLWRAQFNDACGNSLMFVKAGDVLEGLEFIQVARILFLRAQSVALGVCIKKMGGSVAIMNPGRYYTFHEDDIFVYISFVELDIEKIFKGFRSSSTSMAVERKPKDKGGPPKKLEGTVSDSSARLLGIPNVLLSSGVGKAKAEARIHSVDDSINNHVLVITDEYRLGSLVMFLRTQGMDVEQAQLVVIMCCREPTEDEWEPLATISGLSYVVGNFNDPNDLIRAGCLKASKILIYFADPTGNKTVMAQMALDQTREPEKDLLVISVAHDTNEFLERRQDEKIRDMDDSWAVFSSSINASGRLFFVPEIGKTVSGLMADDMIYKVFLALIGVQTQDSQEILDSLRDDRDIENSYLDLVEVPPGYVGTPYSDLFNHYIDEYGSVLLGLLRVPQKELGNSDFFVYLNPIGTTILNYGDRAYAFRIR